MQSLLNILYLVKQRGLNRFLLSCCTCFSFCCLLSSDPLQRSLHAKSWRPRSRDQAESQLPYLGTEKGLLGREQWRRAGEEEEGAWGCGWSPGLNDSFGTSESSKVRSWQSFGGSHKYLCFSLLFFPLFLYTPFPELLLLSWDPFLLLNWIQDLASVPFLLVLPFFPQQTVHLFAAAISSRLWHSILYNVQYAVDGACLIMHKRSQPFRNWGESPRLCLLV